MTDDKKPDDAGDLDWDQALSEWESTSFGPDSDEAKEPSADKPGAPAGPARPLYRPPTTSPGTRPRLPGPVRMYEPEEATEATRIARVPEELLNAHARRDSSAMPQGRLASVSGPTAPPPPAGPASASITMHPEAAVPPEVELREEDDPGPHAVDMEVISSAPVVPSPIGRGPALLVPKLRNYDPNEVTAVGKASQLTRPQAVDIVPPSERSSGAGAEEVSATRPLVARAPLAPARTWADEKPASEWLSATTREELETRAAWLEEEARALDDTLERGRALLACSELFATSGDRDRAHALAVEARDTAPALALAHRQARALMPSDREDCVAALDTEVERAPTDAARVHSALLATEMLRAAGQDDAVSQRLDAVAQFGGGDVRAAVTRAARALAREDTASSALQLPDGPELAPLAEAIATCLRLRGVANVDAGGDADRSPNEVLLLARQALDKGDPADAATLVAELASIPELATAARWLAASLGATRAARRPDAARWLQELADRGDEEACRSLVARALELGDTDRLRGIVEKPGPLTSAERVTLAALAGLPLSAIDPHLDATASTPGMQTLAAALTAIAMPAHGDLNAQVQARAERTAGSDQARARVRLGRLLASSAPPGDVEAALAAIGSGHGAETRAIALEMSARAGRTSEVAGALEAWGAGWGSREEGAIGAIAAALVAERAADLPHAVDAFKAARTADPTNEAALRAIASLEAVDLVAELNELADELGEGPRGALARLEAASRGEKILPDPTRAHMLGQAHAAAPSLPMASFLAERIARRAGDGDEAVRLIRERRAETSDAVEAALDAVREALLIADRDPQLAGERLQEAHRARPQDVALRELYERMGSDPPEARAAWRERRAADASGERRTLMLLEAAREFERAGDDEGALRCAEAAGANDAGLGAIARERAELRGPRVARLAEELLSAAKTATEPRTRREAYERLAVVDAGPREDPASALLWHRLILEEFPEHEPSLRHVEHHLIGEGRDDELEPIAAAIAVALRAAGPGEGPAHAELAARLHLRAPDAKWDGTRAMVELAAAEAEPSLWSLRMLQAHGRARDDDDAFLGATLRLLDRASRPADRAAFLVLAGEAAWRLGRVQEARSLLGQASAEDPGDVVTWTLLAEVRRRAGDTQGAAEAFEALARSSLVPDHQWTAWYEAARIWLDEIKDEGRALAALEAAATIDPGHQDVFDRLSSLYASRQMHAELAGLLERRIGTITDPDERLALDVRRGKVLLEAADMEGARRAFEAALAERPEDSGALSAFADVCAAQHDWPAAEQALVRLARLLPTPEEQRNVYARLGDLYSLHLLNLSRAEVALKEVLKRTPDDIESIAKLIDVYKRQNDPARAIELQQDLVHRAQSPVEKRQRVLELSAIHEYIAHDNRRAEQALEAARREFPQDVGVLRVLAEFYMRHHQAPAVNILLDRAGGDARRALAAGRIAPALFEVLATVFDLRDKEDAARVTRGMLAAIEGRPAEMSGAGPRAFDPRLDDSLAPGGLTPSLRTLLAKTGDALDHFLPVDLRALKATPLAVDSPLARLASSVGQTTGLGPVQVLVSPNVGSACIPVGSSPATIVVGEGLVDQERAAAFLAVRALKLVHARASVLARATPADLAIMLPAWLKCFNPTWQPPGADSSQINATLHAASARIQAALPRNLDPDIAIIALEAAGTIGAHAEALGARAIAWANRVALLSLGDPNAALDAIAAANGEVAGAPRDATERSTWISRTPEACDLIAFAVTDAFAEARARLGLHG
jgi:predicted Zn-dependent protease